MLFIIFYTKLLGVDSVSRLVFKNEILQHRIVLSEIKQPMSDYINTLRKIVKDPSENLVTDKVDRVFFMLG